MEFDKNKCRPSSLGELRLQQVNEQSEVCDIMVKVDKWEKKYHKCVLQFCPFFDCLFRHDFLERYTETVIVKRGKPSNVDTALMSLYGKKPRLRDDNIADIIDLAEFFMIQDLKTACVKWLKSATVLEENCLQFLQLSSLYNFDLPNCTKYFISHLVEMLSHEMALNLTSDSVNYLLSEMTFSYLGMEERLKFIARWYKKHPKYRFLWVKHFLKMLSFEDIQTKVVDNLKQDRIFGQLLSGISAVTYNPDRIIPVHIIYKRPNVLGFDMERKRWYKIDLCATENVDFSNIIDTDPNSPDVYINDNLTDEKKVVACNLDTGMKKEYKVETDYDDDATASGRFQFCSNMLAGCDTKSYTLNQFSTVYIRYNKRDDDVIKMMPMFSLKGTIISLQARTPFSEVAIVLENSDHILIYDKLSCSMTKLKVETNENDLIFPTERGFVIHDDTRCICITRLSGSEEYEVKEKKFNSKYLEEKEYFFCKNSWFRIFCETFTTGFQLQCVDHDTLLAATTPDDIKWNDLPLPSDSSEYCLSLLDGKIHLVGLPARILRCHPECPHCDAKRRESSTSTSTLDSDSEEFDLQNGGYDSDDYE